jgi:hypothetical protein
MFEHPNFDRYIPDEIPLDIDLHLRDEATIGAYEASLLALWDGRESKRAGRVVYAVARRITSNAIHLSWFPNVDDRYHELSLVLPRDQIIECVGASRWDEKPSIFVKGGWLASIHARFNSVFALVDAIGVKAAIRNGVMNHQYLTTLRSAMDELAGRFPQLSFISFADTVVLKSNWTAGDFRADIKYTYQPEVFLSVFEGIRALYQSTLGLGVYGVVTQGSNEYYDDPLLHISKGKNHVCLNSLGAPFADLKQIEKAARDAIHSHVHPESELYLDGAYFRSLRLQTKFKEEALRKHRHHYLTALENVSKDYICTSYDGLSANLE